MKKYILLFSIFFLLVSCTGSPDSSASVDRNSTGYRLPDLEDVVIYQINPRVLLKSVPFRAISLYLDSIKQLGTNVVWFMPIHEIGKETLLTPLLCPGL